MTVLDTFFEIQLLHGVSELIVSDTTLLVESS